MSILQDPVDKRRGLEEYREDFIKSYRRNQGAMSPKSQVEQEKRVRREIANSNERRRMQSINSGFEQIRRMLPPPQEGEKYSKATILQLAVKYIQNLETEANRLATQLKMIAPNQTSIVNCLPVSAAAASLQTNTIDQNSSNTSVAPPRKRKIDETGMKSYEDLNSENVNLRQHLGQLSSDKDYLQRQIEFLRRQISEIASNSNNNNNNNSTNINNNNNSSSQARSVETPTPTSAPSMTAYSLTGQTTGVQMTLQTQTGKNSIQVQKIFASQPPQASAAQQQQQSAAAASQQQQLIAQHLPDGSKVKYTPAALRLPSHHQHLQPQQQQRASGPQQEIIQIPISAAAVAKPGFEPFAVDPVTRSSESASPQPLTLTPATPVAAAEPVVSGQSFPKKSLDALVLAIEQIEGTTMATALTDGELSLLENRCSTTTTTPTSIVNNNNDNNNFVNNNNNNNNNNSVNKNSSAKEFPASEDKDLTEHSSMKEEASVKCEEGMTSSEEYPIVTKLLNRPIPHKYLHRPQVVVNSSH